MVYYLYGFVARLSIGQKDHDLILIDRGRGSTRKFIGCECACASAECVFSRHCDIYRKTIAEVSEGMGLVISRPVEHYDRKSHAETILIAASDIIFPAVVSNCPA